MSYLLDTNIVSELNKQTPNGGVLRWFEEAEETALFISVVTISGKALVHRIVVQIAWGED
jgi:predicted nucleic acid-binding protein